MHTKKRARSAGVVAEAEAEQDILRLSTVVQEAEQFSGCPSNLDRSEGGGMHTRSAHSVSRRGGEEQSPACSALFGRASSKLQAPSSSSSSRLVRVSAARHFVGKSFLLPRRSRTTPPGPAAVRSHMCEAQARCPYTILLCACMYCTV